jgi:glycosyl hydrolase family 2
MHSDIEHAYGWSTKHESDANRLKSIQHHKLTVSPEACDLWFRIDAERLTHGTEVRGRIVGPRCLVAKTVECVFPLRSARYEAEGEVMLIARTAFPEPGFWDPQNPLLYRAVVELWQDGQCCDVSGFDLGFRTIELGSGNVCVNKKPFILRGMTHVPESREDALGKRQAGYNLVVAREGQWHWWVRANPMGFLLLERVTRARLTPHYITLLSQQPCFLGFVLGREPLDQPTQDSESFLCHWQDRHVCMGLELDGPPPQSLPRGLSFLVCPESLLPALANTSLPKIVLRTSAPGSEQHLRVIDGVLGWIDQDASHE